MSEREYNEIFAENLKRYLDLNDMSQTDLARRLGVSAQSVTNWCSGKKSPRMDKVDAMCAIFNCNRSDLMEVQISGQAKVYYQDTETAQLAQEMFEDKDMRALFNMKKNMDPETGNKRLNYAVFTRGCNTGCNIRHKKRGEVKSLPSSMLQPASYMPFGGSLA